MADCLLDLPASLVSHVLAAMLLKLERQKNRPRGKSPFPRGHGFPNQNRRIAPPAGGSSVLPSAFLP